MLNLIWIMLIFAEHSGQNFDEEEDETLCCMHTTKRMKIVGAATENQE